MLRRHFFTVCLLLMCFCASAQVNLTPVEADSMLRDIHSRVSKLNNHDPELISLHYLFAKDIEKELRQFNSKVLPALKASASSTDYYSVLNHYDRVSFYARNVKDTLADRKNHVDSLFYVLAVNELMFDNKQEARYFADRSLEYNPLYTDALLLKLNLLYEEDQFDDCIEVIHILYNEAALNRDHEMQISDFTLMFYNKLYSVGDSLVRIGHEAEALEIFTLLEQFCHNMPSNYCNDDYYKGILRSKTGVYNSYLTIAEVAIERKNADMASKFIEYAIQYEKDNPGEILDNSKLAKVETELQTLLSKPSHQEIKEESQPEASDIVYQEEVAKRLKEEEQVAPQNKVEEQPVIVEQPVIEEQPLIEEPIVTPETIEQDEKTESVEPTKIEEPVEIVEEAEKQEPSQEEIQRHEEQMECDRLVVEGLTYCYQENYCKAYELLSKAKSMGACDSDTLNKLLDSLKKICE